ncbi:sensor histidine kinase [Paenibacillus chartarius]|uniref:histidine kinase n=1 Tax=Paenibacillus chartarius TaxID=747481 RepID=A0ABV6DLB5_9BACL
MGQWLRSSLRRRLSLAMLVATIIPLLLLGGLSFILSSRITESNAKQAGIDTLRQIEGNVSFMLQDVENISIFLIGLSDVQTWLSGNVEDEAMRARILGLMSTLASSKRYIADITIYPRNSISAVSTANIYQSALPRQFDMSQVEGKLWTGLYPITTYAGQSEVLSFVRPLRAIGTYQTVGWLAISLDEKMISRYWADPSGSGAQSTFALVNEKGDILSSTDKTWLSRPIESLLAGITSRLGPGRSGSVTYGEGAGKKTVLFYKAPQAGWTLLQVLPYRQYGSQNQYILLLTVLAIVIAVAATGVMVLIFVQRVTKPLTVLTRLLGRVDPDQPLPQYPLDSPDEVGRLAASYNRLGMHIARLKEQLIQNETRKKEADMRALQAQINPHFLYNTLSSIHWISLMTGEKRITDMVGALSEFLRFSLNKGKDFCTVHQELAHIKNYTQVQSIRYPDKFELEYVVDPTIQEATMLKLLLQPLVENAMIHGIQKKPGLGKITVYVERVGTYIHFLVQDTGIGMTQEQLERVRAQLELTDEQFEREGSSYGLRNVHERLRLHYGPQFGLTIDSELQAGTRISFSIPMLEGSYENHDR